MHILSGDLWGGAEAQMLVQLNSMKETEKAHIESLVLLLNDSFTASRYRKAGLSVEVAEENKAFLPLFAIVLVLARKFSPDVLVTHGYKEALFGAYLALLLRAKLITVYHGAPEAKVGCVATLKYSLYSLLHRFISIVFADRVVAVSASLASQMKFEDLDKLRVIHNVVDVPLDLVDFDARNWCEFFDVCYINIVAIGRLVSVKRFDIAIRAFVRLLQSGLNVRLYIVGDGALRDSLIALVGCLSQEEGVALGDRIVFTGFIENAQKIINSADVLLLTSDSEGIPSVILERMLSRKPFVSSDLPGIREILQTVEAYPAYLAQAGNIDSFVKQLQLCIAEHKCYSEEEFNSRFVSNFSSNAAVSKHVAMYRELCSK